MPPKYQRTLSGPMSQSAAKSIEDCPAKFKAEAEGLEPHFEPFDRGSVIAEIAEVLRLSAIEDPIAELPVIAWQEFDKRSDRLSADAAEEVRSIIRGFFTPEFRINWRVNENAGAVIRLEEPWALDADFNAVALTSIAIDWRGTFDVECVDDWITIEDDKTWAYIPTADEIATDIQARTYARAALARYPKASHVTFRWNLLRHGFSLEYTFERGAPWQAEHEAWLRRRLEERDRYLAEKRWPVTPGDGCDTCPIRHACPELAKLHAQGARIPETDPVARAKAYLALKGLLTEYEKAVRRDGKLAPTPVGDGKFLGFEARPKREIKAGTEPKLRSDLLMLGATEEQLASWFPPRYSVSAVETAFKSIDSETARVWIASHVQRVKTAHFTTFRPAADGEETS